MSALKSVAGHAFFRNACLNSVSDVGRCATSFVSDSVKKSFISADHFAFSFSSGTPYVSRSVHGKKGGLGKAKERKMFTLPW